MQVIQITISEGRSVEQNTWTFSIWNILKRLEALCRQILHLKYSRLKTVNGRGEDEVAEYIGRNCIVVIVFGLVVHLAEYAVFCPK
jgi:hypothetical protein